MPENIEAAENNEEAKTDETIEIADIKRKKVTFGDIISVQAIMCLAAAIAFVGINIFKPELATGIFEIYLEKNTNSGSLSNVIRVIADFLQSTPLS